MSKRKNLAVPPGSLDAYANVSAAQRAVASACFGAELIREARASGSRRVLGRQAGITASVLAGIEDCSILPSVNQLAELSRHLVGIRAELFEQARSWGTVPWGEAVRELLHEAPGQGVDELSRCLAAGAKGCEPDWVRWRLSRQLRRLAGTGEAVEGSDCTWTARPQAQTRTSQGRQSRWRKHAIATNDGPEQDALFHLESEPGHCAIVLNRSHPLYSLLHSTLGVKGIQELDEAEARELLEGAVTLVRELLVAWADYEDNEKAGPRQDRVREVRQMWGRHARGIAMSGEACTTLGFQVD